MHHSLAAPLSGTFPCEEDITRWTISKIQGNPSRQPEVPHIMAIGACLLRPFSKPGRMFVWGQMREGSDP